PNIQEIRKDMSIMYRSKSLEEAEEKRKQLIELNKLLTKDLDFEHPNSKYHSRLLNPMLDSLGLLVNSTHSFRSDPISDKIKQECEEYIVLPWIEKNDRNTESTQLFQMPTVMSPGACNLETNMDDCDWNKQQCDQYVPFDSENMSLGAGTYNHVVDDTHPWNYNHTVDNAQSWNYNHTVDNAQPWNYNQSVDNAQPWNEYIHIHDFREQIKTSQRVYDYETKSHILNIQQLDQHTQSNCEEYTTIVRNAYNHVVEGT
ncbi:9020_t:CDS:2, partial [Acaulospora morrowiae]